MLCEINMIDMYYYTYYRHLNQEDYNYQMNKD